MAVSSSIQAAIEIVAAYVSSNSIPPGELPQLIGSIHAAITGTAEPILENATADGRPAPAVSIRKSITAEYLICLDDGKRFKLMRSHLALLGMTPEQYRMKWGLPPDYPMVAPNYAAMRSNMAKSFGLGQIRKKPIVAPPQATTQRKRGRPRKSIS